MNRPFAFALLCVSSLFVHFAAQAGEIRLYTEDNFKGRVVVLRETRDDLSRVNVNDTVSSIQVDSGSWEVCERRTVREMTRDWWCYMAARY